MTIRPADRIEIAKAPMEWRSAALDLIFAHLAPEDRAAHVADLLATANRAPDALDGLLTATRGGDLIGAGLAQLQPGRAATIWPPTTQLDLSTPSADALIAALLDFATRRGALLAQALLRDEELGEEALRRAGFSHTTDLAFLFASTESCTPAPQPHGLKFESYKTENHARLAAVVDQTYVDTLDCPEVNGVRDVEDVLAGYRATGSFSPERWMIVLDSQGDVGCLLLADHPAVEQWELVYMGLVPAARGRGYGAAIARHALWLAGQSCRPRMVVAVDVQNRPAMRVYEAARFVVWDRRRVYLKPLAVGASS